MEQRKKELTELLNKLFKIKDVNYTDLNQVIPFTGHITELRELEEKYPKLGLARFDTEQEGISVMSLIATITDILCDTRLAFEVSDEFVGVKDLNEKTKEKNDIKILSTLWYKKP